MNSRNSKKAFLFWFSLLIILGGYPQFSFSQFGIFWEDRYGGSGWEEMNGVVAMEDHCAYVFGGFTSSNQSFTVQSPPLGPGWDGDVWLVWTDTMGTFNQGISCSNVLYGEKRYGGSGFDRMQNLKRTPDGGLIFVGSSNSQDLYNPAGDSLELNYGGMDIYVSKMDAHGNIEWQRSLGGNYDDYGMTVTPTEGEKYLVCGWGFSDSSPLMDDTIYGNSDIWAFLLDENGSIDWAHTYGADSIETVTAAVVAADNDSEPGFVIGGATFSNPDSGNLTGGSNGAHDWVYFKIDKNNGDIIWQQYQGMDGQDDILDIFVTNDNQYLITGFTERNPADTLAYGREDLLIQKVDQSGNFIWEQIYGGSELDWGYSATQNSIGNYIIVGTSASPANPPVKDAPNYGMVDYWVLHIDSEGNKFWDQSFGGDHQDSCTKIEKAINGGYILGGHTQSQANNQISDPNYGLNDMWLIRSGCDLGNPELPDLLDICEGEEVFVDATAMPCEGCTYHWHDGETGPTRTIDSDVDLTQFSVTIVHKDACETFDTFFVGTVPNPTAVLVQVDSVTCFGDADGAVYVDGVIGGTAPYTAYVNGEKYTDLNEIPDFFGLSAGIFDIEVFDFNECFTDTTVVIETPDEPLILLPDDREIELGDSIQIGALVTSNVTSFYWTLPEVLSCDTCLTPWVTPIESFTIGLVGHDKNGCEARDVMTIVVDRNVELHIPNIFSPNGDGQNDYFTAFADKGIKRILDFKIFNRWGELMFETTNIPLNVIQLGWDGYHRGKPSGVGVYTYFLQVEYLDGRIELVAGDFVLAR